MNEHFKNDYKTSEALFDIGKTYSLVKIHEKESSKSRELINVSENAVYTATVEGEPIRITYASGKTLRNVDGKWRKAAANKEDLRILANPSLLTFLELFYKKPPVFGLTIHNEIVACGNKKVCSAKIKDGSIEEIECVGENSYCRFLVAAKGCVLLSEPRLNFCAANE